MYIYKKLKSVFMLEQESVGDDKLEWWEFTLPNNKIYIVQFHENPPKSPDILLEICILLQFCYKVLSFILSTTVYHCTHTSRN